MVYTNIQFQSNIMFVSPKQFSKLPLDKLKRRGQYVGDPWTKYQTIKNSIGGYTDGIKTCVAGGFISETRRIIPRKKFRMFHFNDGIFNVDKFPGNDCYLEKSDITGKIDLNNSHGLIIGSKDKDLVGESSNILFDRVQESFSDCTYSSFKNIHKGCECDIYYSVKEDTWKICAKNPDGNEKYRYHVKTLDGLLSFFKEIAISAKDKLFIGDQEITRNMCPNIFK